MIGKRARRQNPFLQYFYGRFLAFYRELNSDTGMQVVFVRCVLPWGRSQAVQIYEAELTANSMLVLVVSSRRSKDVTNKHSRAHLHDRVRTRPLPNEALSKSQNRRRSVNQCMCCLVALGRTDTLPLRAYSTTPSRVPFNGVTSMQRGSLNILRAKTSSAERLNNEARDTVHWLSPDEEDPRAGYIPPRTIPQPISVRAVVSVVWL